MSTFNLCLLALIAAGLLLDGFFLWPEFLRRSNSDSKDARIWVWSAWMLLLWSMTLAVSIVWVVEEQPWAAFKLAVPYGWRLWVFCILVLLFVLLQSRNCVKLSKSRDLRLKTRPRLEHVLGVLPHSNSELPWFVAMSVTAGFCEEFLFRGYLVSAFQPWLGWWGAAVLSLLVFVAGHAYQGRRGLPGVAVAGLAMTLLVATFESLLPAIVMHVLVDVGGGLIGWIVLRDTAGDMEPTVKLGKGIAGEA